MSGAIRIALADDQALVRAGLRALLQELGITIVFEAEDGDALMTGMATHTVDLIVSDIRMPGVDGIDALRTLRVAGNQTPCIFLTTFDDSDLLLRATEAGAQGFLLKDAAPLDLLDVISRVAQGETFLLPVSTDPLRHRFRFHEEAAPTERFSAKEVAILRLLAGGYSNKEIARSLFLAEGTVKNYVSAILEKLDTRDRTRAVLKAIALRII